MPESLIDATRNHPTLITAIYERDLSSLQGRLMACHPMPKTEQYLRYATAGIPFPPSTVFRWGMKLDPAQFSDFVVMKPINPARSSHGALHLLPTSLIPEIRPQHFPKDHPIHTETMLLQRFVDDELARASLLGEHDFAAFCKQTGNPLLSSTESPTDFTFVISKR